LQEFLRKNNPPIITRIEEDFLVIDPRCLFPEDYPEILRAFQRFKNEFEGSS
jgi:L-seryl-tRNA(Ser) seleniumtransferase